MVKRATPAAPRMPDTDLDQDLDRAFHFAAARLDESGRNPKPVLLHSAKVALPLYNLGYERDIVVAAALHDLIEDADTTRTDIEAEFGPAVADIVVAVSFNPAIEGDLDQAREMFSRCVVLGRSALVVKCADLLDNIEYVHLAPAEHQPRLLQKYELFLDVAKEQMGSEPIYEILSKRITTVC